MRQHRSAKAFTLVEMLIVGALIALFAGLAIFGVQQQYRSNQRKAIIGETRQLAAALDFAYNDLGFFPKIAFLQDSATTLRIESQRNFGNPAAVFLQFQAYSIPTVRESIDEKWNGPYFAASQSRTRISQGRGGSRYMRVRPNSNDVGFPWPLDTWNNPYMFYSLNVTADDGTDSVLYFTTARADDPTLPNPDPSATGNFVTAVVSYGPNQVPGGGELYVPVTGALDDASLPGGGTYALRLYNGNPNNEVDPLTLHTGLELSGTAGLYRANAWSRDFFSAAGFSIDPAGTLLGVDDENEEAVGITDPKSDDVVFTF